MTPGPKSGSGPKGSKAYFREDHFSGGRPRRIEDGIVVELGATVTLAARGTHLMLLDLQAPIAADQAFEGTLVFERAGPVPVRFTVDGFRGAATTPSHEGHKP